MNLTQHLEYVIGLVERGEPPAKIKASLVAMTEEVSGYEHSAARAIQIAEKKPAIETLPAPDQLDSALKASTGASPRAPLRSIEDMVQEILETVRSVEKQAYLLAGGPTTPGSIL